MYTKVFYCFLSLGDRLSRLSQTREIEFVGVSLAVDFGHDVLIVVITVGRMEMGEAVGDMGGRGGRDQIDGKKVITGKWHIQIL